jgi:hypothetical protein
MYSKYGSYTLPGGCASLASIQYRALMAPRGQRIAMITTFHHEGVLIGDPTLTDAQALQNDLNTQISTLIASLTLDYQDVGLYRSDNNLSIHYITSAAADNLTGNQITYLNFPKGDKAEFATARSYAFGVRAVIRSSFSDIVDYKESIELIGDGGPDYSWHTLPNGAPYSELDSLYSWQHVIHRGYAIALTALPLATAPLASGANYLNKLTRITKHHPRKYANTGQYDYYRRDWEYHYRFPYDSGLTLPLR